VSIKKQERSLIPLIIIIGVVAAPLIFIFGIVFGSQIQLANILATDSLSSWISALATVSIAILTFVLAKETWYLRKAQIEQVNELRKENIRPNVSVALKNSTVAFNFKIIEVQNLGKGIARNIKFTYLDHESNVIVKNVSVIVDELLKIHVFANGIHSLGIGQRIESFLFSFNQLSSKLKGDDIFSPKFKIQIYYEDVEGTKYHNELTIDFQEFKGISKIGDDSPLHSMSKELKALREQVEYFTRSSSNRMHVNTYSSDDREEESKQRKIQREEQRKKFEKMAGNNKKE
jgi:hypothetical protein